MTVYLVIFDRLFANTGASGSAEINQKDHQPFGLVIFLRRQFQS